MFHEADWLPEHSSGVTVWLFTVQMTVKNKGWLDLLESSRALLAIQVREHMSEAFVKAPASVAPAAIFAFPATCPFILEVTPEQRKDAPEY